jgi:hypothetical protein
MCDSKHGDVAQLVRALPCHGRGCEFEPRRPRQLSKKITGSNPVARASETKSSAAREMKANPKGQTSSPAQDKFSLLAIKRRRSYLDRPSMLVVLYWFDILF